MKITQVTAGYSERRQLVQYKLSVEVYAEATATVEEGDDTDEVHAEAMQVAKANAGREMRQRIAEHEMQEAMEGASE